MIFLSIVLVFVSAVFNSQMDTIQFRPRDAWFGGWWITNNWQTKNWFLKVPFSFLNDGWHFCKMIRIITLFTILGFYLQGLTGAHFYLITLCLYALHGGVWEFCYGRKF